MDEQTRKHLIAHYRKKYPEAMANLEGKKKPMYEQFLDTEISQTLSVKRFGSDNKLTVEIGLLRFKISEQEAELLVTALEAGVHSLRDYGSVGESLDAAISREETRLKDEAPWTTPNSILKVVARKIEE